MFIDHVVVAVEDLDEAADRFLRDYELVAVEGGRHPDGTENRVIPLEPPQYVELIAAYDPDLEWGAWAVAAAADRPLAAWGIYVDDIAKIAARLDIEPSEGTVELTDGSVGRWQTVDRPGDTALPFFIEYSSGLAERIERWSERYAAANHPCRPGAFAWLEVGADEAAMAAWIGDNDIPVRCTDGEGIQRFAITAPDGEIVIS